MYFKQIKTILKPIKLLFVFIAALLVSSAAAHSPISSGYIFSTPTPLSVTEPVLSATSQPISRPTAMPTNTAAQVQITQTQLPTEVPSPTPFPDWAMTSKDTNGLLFAGILILLIIIIGTTTAMAKKPK
jgi:hypothetical protein